MANEGQAAAADGWQAFATRFLAADGRIVDTGNAGVSHSEGQGYGLLLAAAAGDRAAFDLIWAWTDRTLARPDMRLFRWRFDPRATKQEINNATDGDILIAWALLNAARRWPASPYGQQSAAIRAAILQKLVRAIGPWTVLLPGLEGFTFPGRIQVNPSYYVWPALHAFALADGAQAWRPLLHGGDHLLSKARFGVHTLATDWIDVAADGGVTPAAGRPPRFGFDAIRIPLYLAWGRRFEAMAPYRVFWDSCLRNNRPIPAWIDVVSNEAAPYPISEGAMAVVDLTLGRPPRPVAGDYYSSALGSLVRLAAQGHGGDAKTIGGRR